MSIFTERELEYLTAERRLARLATVGRDGTPHISPVGWSYNQAEGTIEIRGHNLETTKKFRDVARSGRAAVVIDDVLPPWQPRGVEIRGKAEARRKPRPVIVIHPERVIGWGLDTHAIGVQNSRDVRVSA
jgi:pyridoxamine 5'-phosphate oxidase family protein